MFFLLSPRSHIFAHFTLENYSNLAKISFSLLFSVLFEQKLATMKAVIEKMKFEDTSIDEDKQKSFCSNSSENEIFARFE
jgi:hypothetical protein